ncbi:PspC domain-containing protein [Defluviitoga tunisiensis]|jgi:phage shock protein C|uniref:PspC domain n=1 Tax=Defluviitoga tunisiensis TaxID=1006576 RepID=A0A0C7P1G2_DEFTU|nr:PspC domain-containing protein [Defluviitoga tunisiensis]CEP78105.1 PspC domain [Defluviitoga tunisiensis]HOB55850.1 PspC domain-containing protein [Defluviitoga tunisiensis]HOP34499.1 PspC domain-containing protein [Defluviitoga tunisiensis]HPU60183.1 PspC domain-containing protein [Defluviitoga tunisiensis]
MKKLYRSRDNKVLAGVCGGIGEYFEIDPVIIRLIWIVLTMIWGFGLFLYIIAIFLIPLEPKEIKIQDVGTTTQESKKDYRHLEDNDRNIVITLIALFFIVLGIMVVISIIAPSTYIFRNIIKGILGVAMIIIGIYLVFKSKKDY